MTQINSQDEVVVGLTLIAQSDTSPLSPFFAKAGCIAVVRPGRCTPIYFKNQAWTGDWICNLLAEQGVTRLICGFINPKARECLTARGVDIRYGPCRKPAIELVSVFEDLPRA